MNATARRSKSKAEYVASQLLEHIVESGAAPGSSFGTESDLLSQFDVSRPTLREGLRILESQGVVDIRPGPGGGLVTRKPSIEMLAHSLSIFLRLHDVPFATVLRAREVIEPALAREAAQNGSEDDFATMEASIVRMRAPGGDQATFMEENRVFHSAVARASGNIVLEVFWTAISIVASGEHHGIKYSFGNRQHVIDAHVRILQACRKRNGGTAAKEMAAHVGALEHLVKSRYRHLLSQTTRVTARD
ncbi:MAG: FadR/GntR family transcriptional regulator [Hyphomicrobiaceae bacterium]